MGKQQQKVADYLHQWPGTLPEPQPLQSPPSGDDTEPSEAAEPGPGDDAAPAASAKENGAAPGGVEARPNRDGPEQEAPAEETDGHPADDVDPAMADDPVPGTEGRTATEQEELARLLRRLYAAMDRAPSKVAMARRIYPAEGAATEAAVSSSLATELSSALKHPVSIALSGGSLVLLLGLVGWWWYASSAPVSDGMQFVKSEARITLDEPAPVEQPLPQAPQDTPQEAPIEFSGAPGQTPPEETPPTASGEASEVGGQTTASTEMPAAPAASDGNAAPARSSEAPQPAIAAGEPLRGLAGEPIPLGLLPPNAVTAAGVAVMVKGVPSPASLTSGLRVGEDTWVVEGEQARNVALLTPGDYPGGRFEMDVTLVSNDGKVPEARRLTVSVDPAQVSAPPAQQPLPGSETAAAGQQEPAPAAMPEPASTPQPVPALPGAAPQTPTVPETAGAETAANPPAPQPGPQAQPQLQAEAEPQPQPDPTQTLPQEGGAATDIGSSEEAPPAQQQASVEPGEAQTQSSAAVDTEERAVPTRMDTVNTYVNMRAEPDNDAAVITVVPEGSQVGVIECQQWCEVTFADKRGWIYSQFVGKAPSAQPPPAARPSPSQRTSVETGDARVPVTATDSQGRVETGRAASVAATVNMRAQPDANATVVTVVRAGSRVTVLECQQWCRVAHGNKRGWIHSRFVTAGRRSAGGGFWSKLWPF